VCATGCLHERRQQGKRVTKEQRSPLVQRALKQRTRSFYRMSALCHCVALAKKIPMTQ